MTKQENSPEISLPRCWLPSVKAAMLQVISLAQFSMTYTRSWAVNSPIARMRLKAENDERRQEVSFLREEIRIKDVRMRRIDPYKRPHFAVLCTKTFCTFVRELSPVPPENLIRAETRGFGRFRRHLQLTLARSRVSVHQQCRPYRANLPAGCGERDGRLSIRRSSRVRS